MKKFRGSKILSAIVLVAIIVTSIIPLGSFTASAATEADFEYVSFGGSAYIQKYVGSDVNVEIPAALGGNTVTTIDDNVFRNREDIKSVVIPGTVTRIDTSAFEGCTNLESVNLPASLTYIGGKAFYGCESLTTITIPASVTYIGPEVFAWCKSLTEINVDSKSKGYTSVDGVLMDIGKTSIMNYPAAKADTTYDVPSSVRNIKQSAFAGCTSLESITLPNNPLYIYERAFAGCTALKEINLPSNIMSIYDYAFDGCTALEAINVDPKNANFISVDGVLFNKSMNRLVRYPSAKADKTYTIPKTVTYADYGSFADCVNLESITIHKTLTSLRDDAFRGCTALKSIVLPPKMTYVGSRIFEGCTALESITIGTANIYYSSKDGILYNKEKTMIHFYPQGKEDSSFTIPNTVTTIDRRAFYGATNLTSLVIPVTVTSIREDAFLGCDNLTIYAKADSYAYKYAIDNNIPVVATDIVKSISHSVANGKITFTVVTNPGDYSRVKLTTPENLSGSLAVSGAPTVNADGDYVWTIKTDVPKESTEYTFDFRSSVTGKYLKDYSNYKAEIVRNIKSVSYERVNGKVIFTVVSSAGDFNRMKVTLSSDLKGYVAYTDTYVVNADGDYVWTISAKALSDETEYAFDLRSSETGKYIREYAYHTVSPTIKAVYYREVSGILYFTVYTNAGNFNRLRCGTGPSTTGNLVNANSYYENYSGEYVWVFELKKPTETVTLYLDLRNSETGKFIKDYLVFQIVVNA